MNPLFLSMDTYLIVYESRHYGYLASVITKKTANEWIRGKYEGLAQVFRSSQPINELYIDPTEEYDPTKIYTPKLSPFKGAMKVVVLDI